MPGIEQDTIKGMLQALEHMLDTVDRTSTLAGQLVNSQKTRKPLSPPTPKHYEQQLAELGRLVPVSSPRIKDDQWLKYSVVDNQMGPRVVRGPHKRKHAAARTTTG